MSACVGASAAGARVMTATSSAGLALMWEILYVAASNRLPICMLTVNRALSAPINIHCDHSDSMGARDAGWLHLFGENPQESYDNAIQSIRIAEHTDVLLPVMFFVPGVVGVIRRLVLCYGRPTRLRLGVPRKGICLLIAFVMLFGPEHFHSLAQADVQYANLSTATWAQGNRDIHYGKKH